MLTKNDIVKQFDTLTKIEIKKHNDQVLASNVRVNGLDEKIIAIDALVGTLDKKYTDRLTQVNIYVEKRMKALMEECLKLSEMIDSVKAQDREAALFLTAALNQKSDRKEVEKELSVMREIIDSSRKAMAQKLDTISSSFKQAVQELSKMVFEKISDIDEKLRKQPLMMSQTKSDIQADINVAKVDRDGLTREINCLKKEAFITEKKIENLYMLIDRLKKP